MNPWTSQELMLLKSQSHLGAKAIAQMIGRTEKSVRNAAARHRVTLRKPGERRGLVLGQPRGVGWSAQIRAGVPLDRLELLKEQVVNGEVDMGTLEARAREAIEGRPRPICPSCGQRPVERSTTGMCEVCHWQYLARAHRDEADRVEARRRLDAARQEKSRAHRATVVPIRRP